MLNKQPKSETYGIDDPRFTKHYACKHKLYALIRSRLIILGYPFTIDGVHKFQINNCTLVDGIIGTETFIAIKNKFKDDEYIIKNYNKSYKNLVIDAGVYIVDKNGCVKKGDGVLTYDNLSYLDDDNYYNFSIHSYYI